MKNKISKSDKLKVLRDEAILFSGCNLKIKITNENLSSAWISFDGPCAHFPSTSNSREIAYRRVKGRSHKIPFIRRSNEALMRLEVATQLYSEQAQIWEVKSRIPLSFGDEYVHTLVLLAKHKRRADSHNFCKPIGDWLQDVGLINNDANTEIHCFWKHHYPELDLDPASTDIIINRFSITHGHTSKFIKDIYRL